VVANLVSDKTELATLAYRGDVQNYWGEEGRGGGKSGFSSGFYARQHICYSAYMSRQFRLSVCPSVTRVYCIKTAERIIEILSPSDRPIILVFRHQASLRKSDGFTPNGGVKYKTVAKTSNFRRICGYISETVRDRGIITMEDEYKVVCALLNGAIFDDLE